MAVKDRRGQGPDGPVSGVKGMMRTIGIAFAATAALALAGCGSVGGFAGGGGGGLAPLPASPTQPVASNSLQPLAVTPTPAPPPAQAGQLVTTQGQQVAALPTAPGAATCPPGATCPPPCPPGATTCPPAATPAAVPSKPVEAPAADRGVDVSRTDLIGGWRLSSGGESCQLSMALTQWSGGYRASTRGCASPELQKISAWQLNGKQVVLQGSDGTTVATLVAASKEQFNGATTTRRGISFSR